jgi:hypothetical protein
MASVNPADVLELLLHALERLPKRSSGEIRWLLNEHGQDLQTAMEMVIRSPRDRQIDLVARFLEVSPAPENSLDTVGAR